MPAALYAMFKLQSETRGEQTALIDEMIGNQKVVQAFSHEDEALEKFDEINERLTKYSLRATFFSSITNPATRFVNSVVYAGVGLTGALVAIAGAITVGDLTCLLSYANQYTKPFNEISGVVTELQNALACAGRIFELIEEEPQIPEKENAVELTDVKGNVSLTDVEFSYDPKRPLIRNFNLSVKPGQRVAIVGPTGCGKTTVINLLMRFYDVGRLHPRRGRGYPRGYAKKPAQRIRYGAAGDVAEGWNHPREYPDGPSRRDGGGNDCCGEGQSCSWIYPTSASGV